jgi:hypothetical protein
MTQEMDEQLRELEALLQTQFQEQLDDVNARFTYVSSLVIILNAIISFLFPDLFSFCSFF